VGAAGAGDGVGGVGEAGSFSAMFATFLSASQPRRFARRRRLARVWSLDLHHFGLRLARLRLISTGGVVLRLVTHHYPYESA
jgi:hypothetical protein